MTSEATTRACYIFELVWVCCCRRLFRPPAPGRCAPSQRGNYVAWPALLMTSVGAPSEIERPLRCSYCSTKFSSCRRSIFPSRVFSANAKFLQFVTATPEPKLPPPVAFAWLSDGRRAVSLPASALSVRLWRRSLAPSLADR